MHACMHACMYVCVCVVCVYVCYVCNVMSCHVLYCNVMWWFISLSSFLIRVAIWRQTTHYQRIEDFDVASARSCLSNHQATTTWKLMDRCPSLTSRDQLLGSQKESAWAQGIWAASTCISPPCTLWPATSRALQVACTKLFKVPGQMGMVWHVGISGNALNSLESVFSFLPAFVSSVWFAAGRGWAVLNSWREIWYLHRCLSNA